MTVAGQKASLDMTIDLTRFGVQVDAQPPADDQVLDLADLMATQGGAGTRTS